VKDPYVLAQLEEVLRAIADPSCVDVCAAVLAAVCRVHSKTLPAVQRGEHCIEARRP